MTQADARDIALSTLHEWYHGEVGGEALFLALNAAATDRNQGAKWRTLAALECATKELLASAITRLDGQLPPSQSDPDLAPERVAALAGKSWPQLMHWLERIAADALDVMTREAGALPPALASTSAWVLDHERALIDFARRELADDTAHSLDSAQAMLANAGVVAATLRGPDR
jgi:hypothetical protein